MEDDYLINTKKQENLPLHKTVMTVLFGYSFAMTFVSIIFISLFTWKMSEHTPIPKYETTLPNFIKEKCPNLAPIDQVEYTLRRNKLKTILKETQVKYYIMEPGTSMIYFTGVKWKQSERAFLYVISQEGQDFYVCPKFEETKALENIKNQKIVTWNENESPFTILRNNLEFDNSTKVAIAPETRLFIRDGIDSIQVQTINGFPLESRIRMIKSEKELNIMSCANDATKTVFKELYESNIIRTGITESQLKNHVMRALTLVGLSNVWSVVLFGENAAFPHGNYNNSRLRDEDFILLDIGGSLYDYQSDITRTYKNMRDSNNTLVERAWEIVFNAQKAAITAIKPGIKCSAIDQAARNVVDATRWGRGYTYFAHRLGHGMGLQGHEDPYFVDNSDVVLAPGMVLTVEPGIYVKGAFGIRIEDVIVVTENGCRILGEPMKDFNKPF